MKYKLKLDTAENYKKQRRKYEEERRVWEKANCPTIPSLKAKLLAIGGDRISPQPCHLISTIVSRGRLIDLPITLRRMEGNRCHHNIARLWDQRKKRSRLKEIATGYCLNEDGMWRPHSWGLTATHIIETTISRIKYFGISLNAEGADYFTAGFLSETAMEFKAKLEQLKQSR